jgi:hypothetical protein
MSRSAGNTKKRREKKLPDGREIMKRRVPSDLSLRPAKFESDPKKAYTTEQLAELGAITLKWNQIEAHIDFIGSFILFTKAPFWLQLSTDKVLSTRAKLSLLREGVKNATLLDDASKQCIEDCFSQVEQARAYRNAIIHHHIYDHEKGIGSYIDDSHSAYQILVSIDALELLYGILCTLLDELREIDLLFRIETDAQKPGRFDNATGQFHSLDDNELTNRVIPQHTKRILALQRSRKELQKKLPKFPDADLVRSFSEKEDDRIV